MTNLAKLHKFLKTLSINEEFTLDDVTDNDGILTVELARALSQLEHGDVIKSRYDVYDIKTGRLLDVVDSVVDVQDVYCIGNGEAIHTTPDMLEPVFTMLEPDAIPLYQPPMETDYHDKDDMIEALFGSFVIAMFIIFAISIIF